MKTHSKQTGSGAVGIDSLSTNAAPVPALVPPYIEPPSARGRLATAARLVRNPLLSIPQAVYEQDFVPLAAGRTPLVCITDPALLKTLFLDEREKFEDLRIPVFSGLKGLFTGVGPEWKWQRQTCAPIFRHRELMSLVPTFVRTTGLLLDRWRRSPAGSRHDIEQDMIKLTVDALCATLLPSEDATVGPTIEASANRYQKSLTWLLFYVVFNAPRWLPRPGRRAMQKAIHTARSSVAAVLREHRTASVARDDLVQRLMNSRDPDSGMPMNDEYLIDNLLAFYLAGYETTAMALTWTLYLLARSPEWTNLLKGEIARVTGGAPVTAQHIDKLVLTQQVLKESMRLYPPVSILGFKALADVTIGSHTFKAGTTAIVPIYAIHRHRKRWHNPSVFDPTRFAPENEGKILRYQYLPFGAGPHICLGMAFAIIEATAMLATMLQAVRLEAVDDHQPVPIFYGLTLHPKGGMALKVWPEGVRRGHR